MQSAKRRRVTVEDTYENIDTFIPDFINDNINKYQKEFDRLNNENRELSQKYNKLLTQVHQYDPIKINIKQQDVDKTTKLTDDSSSSTPIADTLEAILSMSARLSSEDQLQFLNNMYSGLASEEQLQFLSNLSWNDVITVSHKLAEENNREQVLRYNEIVASQTFPKIVIEPPLTKIDPVLLVHKPYYGFFDNVVEEYNRLQNNVAITNTDLGIKKHVILLPSQWVIDFLRVFDIDNKDPNILYPITQSFQNIYLMVMQINSSRFTSRLRQYTPDMHYHIMRFISTLTSIMFTPPPDTAFLFPATIFSDIYLLCHFAVMLEEVLNPDNTAFTYEEFLRNEYTILKNTKGKLQLQRIVTDAVLFLVGCLDKSHRFYFVNNRNIYLRYIVNNTANDKSIQLRSTPVPETIVKVLRPLILNNHHNYKQRYQQLRYQSSENTQYDITDLSPIGQLLNHDETAISEFTTLSKKYGPNITINLLEDINMMACVNNLFAILQQAAWAIHLSKPTGKWLKDIIPNVLDRSIYFDDKNKGVMYGSTGEILPGIYIRHMFSDYTLFSEESTTHQEISSFVNEDFFNKPQRSDRVSFFNLFRTYSRLVPPTKDVSSVKKIRTISHESIHQFYITTLKSRSFIRSCLLNVFLATKEKSLDRNQERQVMNYFKDNFIVTPESTPLNVTIDVFRSYQDKELGDYNFYINPCTYRTISLTEDIQSDKYTTNRSIYRPPSHSQVYEDISLDNVSSPGLTQTHIS